MQYFPRDTISLGRLLRHPADHWLRQALPAVADAQCRAVLEAQIARLQPTYQQLCAMDWTAEEAAADLVCEIQVIDSPGSWKKPVPAVVTAAIKGDSSTGQQIAVRLVEYPDGPFNGTLLQLLAGGRWLICARDLQDGTVLPLDGTRRRAAATRSPLSLPLQIKQQHGPAVRRKDCYRVVAIEAAARTPWLQRRQCRLLSKKNALTSS